MPKFFYVARDKTGKRLSGTEEGLSQEEIISRLQSRGLLVVTVVQEELQGQGSRFRPDVAAKVKLKAGHYGVKGEDLVLFCRQLATLLGAGVTILKALEIISKQIGSRKMHNILLQMEKDMEAGLSLHEAMAKHKGVFSSLWINLVDSGEASGNLSGVLTRLATYLERLAEFKRKIISALVYPGVLMSAGLAALFFLTVKIVPTFTKLFKSFNIELPFLTKVLMTGSDFIRSYMILMIIGVAVAAFFFKQYLRTYAGRKQFETFLFMLPQVGDFFRAMAVEKFSSEMATLIESGVPILYSLEIVEHSVDNLTLGDIIRRAKEGVREGKALSHPLEQSGFFEPMVVQMIAIGEEIGELAEMFKKINVFYQGYVETFLQRFIAMFEPIMLIFMGMMIGLMVVGMFLPIFQIANIGG